jgi:hypothetical protein
MDDDDERRLERIRRATGWTATEALKRGLEALETDLSEKPPKTAYDIYLELGIEPGEPTRDRASRARELVREAILRKHGRKASRRR